MDIFEDTNNPRKNKIWNNDFKNNEKDIMKECEEYVNQHNVKNILKDCIVQLCLNKPENPISFLKIYFQNLENVMINNYFKKSFKVTFLIIIFLLEF